MDWLQSRAVGAGGAGGSTSKRATSAASVSCRWAVEWEWAQGWAREWAGQWGQAAGGRRSSQVEVLRAGSGVEGCCLGQCATVRPKPKAQAPAEAKPTCRHVGHGPERPAATHHACPNPRPRFPPLLHFSSTLPPSAPAC